MKKVCTHFNCLKFGDLPEAAGLEPAAFSFHARNISLNRLVKTHMTAKALSVILLVFVLIFVLPLMIGLAGGIFGILMGIFGAIIGVFTGIIGAVGGIIGALFSGLFGSLFGLNFMALVFVAGVLILITKRRS